MTPTIPLGPGTTLTMDQMQYLHAKRVLEQVRGNKLRAAKLLGISRMTLYRLLDRHAPQHQPQPIPIAPPALPLERAS